MSRRFLRSLLGAALVPILAGPAGAQAAIDTAALVDRVFAAVNRTDAPGCTVGVDRAGEALIRRGYGMASLEARAPLTESSILESGSVAKQFTAGAVVYLALHGKLDLDDPVRKYLPELPDYGSPLTIRMLLHHTSGVRDMWTLFALAGSGSGTTLFTMSQALRMVYRQRELNFPPNSQYLYSNSGFLLLAEIVKRVSGMPLAQFSRETFFQPLGMDHTQWRDDWNRVVPGRATAYTPAPGGFRVDMPFMSVYGAGGLLTTVGDLLKWNANLDHPAVGGQAWADTLQVPGVLTDGRPIDYAFGLIVGKYRGEREISHSGATGGYRTYLGRWPDRKLSIAVLCNVAGLNTIALGRRVADVYLGGDAASGESGPKTTAGPAIDPGPLAPYIGRYRATATEDALMLSEKDGRLVVDLGAKFPFTALARDHFRSADLDADLRFTRTGERVTGLTMVMGDTTVYEPVVTPPTSARELVTFAGNYRSDELDVTYRVTAADSTLAVQIGENDPETTTRTGPDSFALPGGSTLRFTRTKGRIDGFLLFAGRVKNLRFARR